MNSQWRWALPGALVSIVFAGACQDAPLGPRAPADRSAGPAAIMHPTVFSGRSSDSLVDRVMAQWALHGHPEYQRDIAAWRQRVLGTTRPSLLPDAPDRRATPRSAIISDGTTTQKDPPQVQTHREALHFGYVSSGYTVPSVLEGEMTFVGDMGSIAVGSFNIVSNSGTSYPVNGNLAAGPGQLVGCLDVALSTCGNTRRVSGSVLLNGLPVCDASGSGSLTYAAQNVVTTYSLPLSPYVQLLSGGNVESTASLSANVSALAGSCTEVDPPYIPPGADPSAPYPPPEWPVPEPGPIDPAPMFAPPVETCVTYYNNLLLYMTVVCSPT